jgi:antitoxin VapB
VIALANATWDDFFDAPGVDLQEREQPPLQKRDAL